MVRMRRGEKGMKRERNSLPEKNLREKGTEELLKRPFPSHLTSIPGGLGSKVKTLFEGVTNLTQKRFEKALRSPEETPSPN